VLEQFELRHDVTLLGSIEHRRQLAWSQASRGVVAHLMVQAGQVGGLRFADLRQTDRLAVRSEDTGCGHHDVVSSGRSMSLSSLGTLSKPRLWRGSTVASMMPPCMKLARTAMAREIAESPWRRAFVLPLSRSLVRPLSITGTPFSTLIDSRSSRVVWCRGICRLKASNSPLSLGIHSAYQASDISTWSTMALPYLSAAC